MTGRVDLVLHLQRDNVERALNALASLGFQPQAPVPLSSFAQPEVRESWLRDKNMTVFSLWHPDHPGFAVDLFLQEPFDFDSVYQRALRIPLADVEVTVVSREDLMAMKRAAGRTRDLDDLAALSELSEEDGQ